MGGAREGDRHGREPAGSRTHSEVYGALMVSAMKRQSDILITMPHLEVLQCPSCGANQTYDGGPEITFACQFCGTTIIVPEALRPKAPPSAAASAGAVDVRALLGDLSLDKFAELKRLAQAGQAIEAIRLYREMTGVGLREAKEAVDRLARGQPVVITHTQVSVSDGAAADQAAQMAEVVRLARAGQQVEAIRLMRESNPGLGLKGAVEAVHAIAGESTAPGARARRVAAGAGCAGGVGAAIFVVAIIAFIVGMMYLPFRLSGSYRQALEAAQSHPAVIEAMGAPIVADWWPGTGEISCGGGGCSANYIIPIRGSQSRGRIDVMSSSEGARFLNEGTWVLDAVVVVNSGPTIELTAP